MRVTDISTEMIAETFVTNFNGIIETWNRTLNSALLCLQGKRPEKRPLVLLELWMDYKADINALLAEMVYGKPLSIPADYLTPQLAELPFLISSFCTQVLTDSSHAMLHFYLVRAPLQPPYTGPFQVLQCGDHILHILQNSKRSMASINRVKPDWGIPLPTFGDTSTTRIIQCPDHPHWQGC
ncbi:uncharacterized protein LOC126247103 [Schistocerca nitens]|uniref:uncharacterized protein LOC126247103 n=1 Tax=Schistocerca nitens TaxID=7011 RepID=UPI0021176339|nr:uncharacterized protein LOC126247103 [Schistocerca nitens]